MRVQSRSIGTVRRLALTAALWSALVVAPAETLTLATYNLSNYGPADRVTNDGFRPAYPKPEAEKRPLRQVIRALNADILVVQEMGPMPYLAELRRDLNAEHCAYDFAELGIAADADRHVAILSRRPFVGRPETVDLEYAYFEGREHVKRGLLVAVVHTDAGDLTIFGVHLKSRLAVRPDDPLSEIRRTAEATAIRDEILRRFPDPAGARFVVLGDCNDGRTSKPVERLLRRGRVEIALLLPAADAQGETWTYRYRKEDSYERVDHILVAPELRDSVVGGAALIYGGEGTQAASDHRPVVVRLDTAKWTDPRD